MKAIKQNCFENVLLRSFKNVFQQRNVFLNSKEIFLSKNQFSNPKKCKLAVKQVNFSRKKKMAIQILEPVPKNGFNDLRISKPFFLQYRVIHSNCPKRGSTYKFHQLKYYSPVVTHDDISVYDFCALGITTLSLFTRHKSRRPIFCNV